MIDFRPDEEQQMLIEAIGRFADERVSKVFRDAEEEGDIPADVLRSGWEIGLLPTLIPESYGGFGEHSVVTGALAMEKFAYGDLAVTLNLMTPNLVAMPLLLAGTEAQKAHYLPLFCDEAKPAMTSALTEPVIRFNPRKLNTTAEPDDGNTYLLNGTKIFVPLADSADMMLVYANENGTTQAFLVPTATDGVTVGDEDRLMGLNGLRTFKVTFDNVRLSAENKLGGHDGIDFGLLLNHSRVALAAAAVGMADAAYDYAREYAKQRVQFGEPVAHKQSIAFMLADMATDVDAARLMVWEAAWKLDQGQDATADITIMKQYVDEVVVQVADRAVQALGGYGYIREYPVELYLRNARGFATFDGLAMI